ncbi:hypothetical protein [Vulcaniibacterium tengchongense]|uniref:hypothetical protein n=1 Tax=Vulcaniibacterium tengchongense TaxID=1273429 RepID=UPI000F4FE7A5|nr:hypothetical protein [Vulcaniibacterium tengchongense]
MASVLDGRRGELDLLLMPTLYLYRHYIELACKAAIRDMYTLRGKRPQVKAKHSLEGRWKLAFQLVEELTWEVPAFPEADRFVHELQRHDPVSEAFRYPETKHGARTAPELRWVNFRRLADGIEHVHEAVTYLEGSIDYLKAHGVEGAGP